MLACSWTISRTGDVAEIIYTDMRTQKEYEFSKMVDGETDSDIIGWIIEQCGAGDNDTVRLSNGKVCFLNLSARAAA